MKGVNYMINMHKKLLGEVPTTYNGGGKSGQVRAEAPKPMSTTTSIGSQLDAPIATFGQEGGEEKAKNLEKKAKGTRGLRIPLAAEKTPLANSTSSGVQL